MSPPDITLPPIIVTPDPPLPNPPGPLPGGGVIAKPLPWDGKFASGPEVDAFFNQERITSDRYTMSVIVTVASAQRSMEQSYTAYLPQLPADVEAEIAAGVGPNPLSELEKANKEKSVVDGLIAQNTAELATANAAATAFFGRNVLAVEMKKSAVYFVNIFQSPKNPNSPLDTYKNWEASATAAYSAKILEEKIRILTEKSALLTQNVATAQAAEDVRLAAEAEAKRIADEAAAAEAARIAAEVEAKRVADEAAAVEAARVAAEAEAKRIADEAAAAEAARIAAEVEAKRVADEAAAAEAARVAAEAEAKRIADEAAAAEAAEAARIAAEAAEQARLAAEAIRVANTFRAPGPASAAAPFVITSAGTIAVIEAAAVTLQTAIRSAIAALTSLAAGTASGLLVGVSALIYSPKLANGELPERYTFSTPVSDLTPELSQDLPAIAAAGGTVDLPVRLSSKTAADGQSEVIVVKTDGVTIPSKVRVVAATYNAEQNLYSVTTGDAPPRTLTWTPIVDPGNSSTTLPAEQPAPPVYTGASVTPVEGRIDTFPGVADAGFDDFVTVFPADSGLPPIYVMFRDRREDPGVATGVGQPVSGTWLGAASQGEGAPIPSQIADQLRGKEFKNFREFRETFWKAVASDPELAKQFILTNRDRMITGKAAKSRKADAVGKRSSFELHHIDEVAKGGDIYNIENMRVLTPKRHIDIHKEVK
ncbi:MULTISPECIES: S-type pyocin domain-containing protein [Pseudomonas fluorescens group]|uniref:S-type pyocin domain-containing protein n=1 Tax=Pseudomonas fluorescens TaxID=294 RepID=A0AAE2PXZ5_PSEFL|nr:MULTISPECIES: S-type pyocin domain-containing protein [Pseudomonas fluorescens group]MBD8270482.1 S-type pyocin domain-containing protein [Pseudomonas fluorescens]UOB24394.1 S-type pyocin domain-containing protein [Pseudomonas orientalis]